MGINRESDWRTTINPCDSASRNCRPVFHAWYLLTFQRGLAGYPANPQRIAGWCSCKIEVRIETLSLKSTTLRLRGFNALNTKVTPFFASVVENAIDFAAL
jgi:hypothetical protein